MGEWDCLLSPELVLSMAPRPKQGGGHILCGITLDTSKKKTSIQSTSQLLLILPHVFLHHIINTQHRNQILKKEKKIKLATGEKIIQWAGKAYDFQKPIIHLPFNR